MKEYNELKDVIKLCKDEIEKDDTNIYANLDLVDLKELKELLEEVEYLRRKFLIGSINWRDKI